MNAMEWALLAHGGQHAWQRLLSIHLVQVVSVMAPAGMVCSSLST